MFLPDGARLAPLDTIVEIGPASRWISLVPRSRRLALEGPEDVAAGTVVKAALKAGQPVRRSPCREMGPLPRRPPVPDGRGGRGGPRDLSRCATAGIGNRRRSQNARRRLVSLVRLRPRRTRRRRHRQPPHSRERPRRRAQVPGPEGKVARADRRAERRRHIAHREGQRAGHRHRYELHGSAALRADLPADSVRGPGQVGQRGMADSSRRRGRSARRLGFRRRHPAHVGRERQGWRER